MTELTQWTKRMWKENTAWKTYKFVVNNWTAEDRSFFEKITVNFIRFGEEVGDQGTPHLQGHIKFARNYRPTQLKKLHEKAHWEHTKDEDANYELKGENIHERDHRKKKGTRSDLDDIKDMVVGGASLKQIAIKHTGSFIRYHKGIERLQQLLVKEHEESEFELQDTCDYIGLPPMETQDGYCNVIIGPPNCGKTQWVLSHFNKPLLVTHIDTLLDYDADYHDAIVFDDMDFKHYHRTAQIHITDWNNSRQIHCRYRTAKIPKHTVKVFVCNEYPFTEDPAIRRRVIVTKVNER